MRSCVAVVSGATALGLAVYRRPRRALAAGGLALALLAASGGTRVRHLEPEVRPGAEVLRDCSPRAPSVVGNARSIVTEFDVYQQELARLVTNVTKLYDVTSTLPAYQPDPTTIRVLHVSDIHLNPASWQIIASLVEQYEIDVIIDSGDTMDHGTAAENGFLDPIADLGAPYVWVRGNHDSRDHPALPGEHARTCTSSTTAGRSPSRACASRASATPSSPRTARRRAGGDPAERWRAPAWPPPCATRSAAGTPVDIADRPQPGRRPRDRRRRSRWSWPGHIHHRETEVLTDGTRLRDRGLDGRRRPARGRGQAPRPDRASVLYLDRDTRRLQAWDEIKLGGLGLTTAEVSRHLPGGEPAGRRASPGPAPVHGVPRPVVPVTVTAHRPGSVSGPVNRFGDTLPASHMLLTSPTRCRSAQAGRFSPHRLVAQDAALSRR